MLFFIRQVKPYKLIDIGMVIPKNAAVLLSDFLRDFDLRTMNVAGPSASHCSGIYHHVNRLMCLLLDQVV